MNRDIKFRAWNKETNCFFMWNLSFAFGGTGELWGDVQQYTGLKDTSEKEIYEDDIIECETEWNFYKSDMIGKIIFSNGCFKIKGNVLKNTNNLDSVFSLEEVWNIKIIGNIYENPELLK